MGSHESPLRPRVCRDEGCWARVFVARRMQSGKWLAFNADPIPEGSQLRALPDVYVLVGDQAWLRRDFIEHWHVTRERTEDAARRLADEYEHHTVHHHPREEDTPDGQDPAE